MEVLTHFRTIEELTKTLSREQGLLSEMFEKRKLMKFPQGLALELVGGNEARLRKLLDDGVLVETGNTVEIESDYLNFFEEVLNVNEEISVLSVQECINTLKEHIGYFLQETKTNRKAGYQDSVRQLLKKTGFRNISICSATFTIFISAETRRGSSGSVRNARRRSKNTASSDSP